MFRLIIIIILFASTCFSQQSNVTNQTEGEKIVRDARRAIGLDKTGEVSSYFYKFKEIISLKDSVNFESFQEISLKAADKIQVIYSGESPLPSQFSGSSKLTRTWNGEKYKSIFESESGSGQRSVRDMTELENKPLSKAVNAVLGKKTTAALQDSQKTDPKNILMQSLWTSIFPMILSHPFEKTIEFKYVGKAKSNDKTANVIDLKPLNGDTYRLLFDTETNFLLMMIVSHKETNERFVGDVETKYYFSERELTSGVLIPKKIKVEKKATPVGKSPIIKYSNIEIVDFKLNPKLDEKTFEIK